MYKIYLNDLLFLLSEAPVGKNQHRSPETLLIKPYDGQKKSIQEYLDLLEQEGSYSGVNLFSADLATLWADFQSLFTPEIAAGGIVSTPDKKVLVMMRRGYWDLPKGKLEKNESIEEAAIREVVEETGVVNPVLGAPLATTYHIFKRKKKTILKITYWFRMTVAEETAHPQAEEGIEEIKFVHVTGTYIDSLKTFGNIRDLLWQIYE